MSYLLLKTKLFEKNFNKLDKYTQKIINKWVNKNLINCENPRQHGKALSGDLAGLWRYRIGNYRLICIIEDDKLIILAVSIGKRDGIYKGSITPFL